MPKRVTTFERLYYLALLVGLVQIILTLDEQTAIMAMVGQGLVAAIAVNVLSYALYIALIYIAARKAKNWARLVLLAFFVVAVVFVLPESDKLAARPLLGTLTVLYLALEAAGLFFAFTGESKDWFRARAISSAA